MLNIIDMSMFPYTSTQGVLGATGQVGLGATYVKAKDPIFKASRIPTSHPKRRKARCWLTSSANRKGSTDHR